MTGPGPHLTPPHVSYGLLESFYPEPPIVRLLPTDGSLYVVPVVRRKKYVTWRDENGQKWGRWDWDYS